MSKLNLPKEIAAVWDIDCKLSIKNSHSRTHKRPEWEKKRGRKDYVVVTFKLEGGYELEVSKYHVFLIDAPCQESLIASNLKSNTVKDMKIKDKTACTVKKK
jgi:intein/homing endonuclease